MFHLNVKKYSFVGFNLLRLFCFVFFSDPDSYNWLSFRVVVVVVIFSVSPFSCPFDIVVMTDFITTVFELVSVVSLQLQKNKGMLNHLLWLNLWI